MPRRKTNFAQGHYYHIYNRGAGRERIFFNEANYLYCLKLLERNLMRYSIAVIAYCLMPNHYHFLLRQDGEKPLSKFINAIFNAYAQAVNLQQGRSGTLFEGRFRDVWVDKEGYLLHLCRYIHANPVKAGLVSSLLDWPYSNYHEWIGERPGTLVDLDFVDTYFLQRDSYTEFVLDYLRGEDDLPKDIQQYLFE